MRKLGRMPVWLVLGALCVVPVRGGESSAARDWAPVDITYSALNDLHHWVRAVVDGRAEPWDSQEFDQAVAQLESLRGHLRHSLDYGPLDVLILRSESAEVALEHAEILPAPRGLRGDVESYRDAASQYVEALALLVEDFERAHWPARRAALAVVDAWLEREFIDRPEVLAWHAEALDLEMPDSPVTLALVTRTGWPGGFTYNDGHDRGVSFVALSLEPRSLLYETVLHELTHALEVQGGDQSVPARIRAGLLEAGVSRRDPRVRDAWHTLYFIQSAQTTRRWLDAQHVPYGDARGLYARTGPIAQIEQRVWESHRRGEMTSSEAIDRMVERVLALIRDGDR